MKRSVEIRSLREIGAVLDPTRRPVHAHARRALLLSLAAALAGCSWQVRATRAVGLCPDRAVIVTEARGDHWMAQCENRIGLYACSLRGGSASCEYVPICGNDGHHDTRTATFRR